MEESPLTIDMVISEDYTMDGASGASRDFGLTPRVIQVIALIVACYMNKDCALNLGISEHTAKHHLTNILTSIFDKLGASNRLKLVLVAINHRLIYED